MCVELDLALHDSYLKRGLELVNALTRTPWDQNLPVDLSAVFNSCIAWASTLDGLKYSGISRRHLVDSME